MDNNLKNVKTEDCIFLAPCGLICAGCDSYTNESNEAAKKIIEIWEGHNFADIAMWKGLNPQDVQNAIKTLKKYIKTEPCPGCLNKQNGSCAILKCVKEKGYWTCAECEDFNPDTIPACPNIDSGVDSELKPISEEFSIISNKYKSDNISNLKKCREIGYPMFIEEIKEKIGYMNSYNNDSE